jgi:hypothetical protein
MGEDSQKRTGQHVYGNLSGTLSFTQLVLQGVMMMKPQRTFATIICLLAAAMAAYGQSREITVNDRPAVGLILLDKLMSGRSRVGDRVHYETLANVYAGDNRVLIPAGSPAYGTVTRSKGSGMFGKRGQLAFTCDYVALPDGERVPLVGDRLSKAGTNDIGSMAAVTLLVSPLGLLIKGGTIIVDTGTPVTMYIADGARVRPAEQTTPGARADLALRDKDAPDVVGTLTAFDGNEYTVKTDDGQETRVWLADIKSISLDAPPSP